MSFAIAAILVCAAMMLVCRHWVTWERMEHARLVERAERSESRPADTTEVDALRARLAELENPRLTAEQAAELLAETEVPSVMPGVLPATKSRVFDTQKCQHCGGIHARACPRVKRIAYGDGGKPVEVQFWPNGTWPEDQVLWLEDVIEAGEAQ